MNLKDILSQIVAVCIILFGFLAFVGSIANIIEPDIPKNRDPLGFALMGLLLGVIPSAFGIWWFMNTRKNAKKRQVNDLYTNILRFAQSQEGKITPQEVVLHLNLPFEQASNLLNEMQSKGIFELQLTEKGAYVYSLLNYATAEEKRRAEGI